jgi:glycosyltransferase involved in cell wall biosynthesis
VASTVAISVAVIIPTLNEAQIVGRCLRALARVSFPRDQLRIVVVDNGSTDATLGVVEAFRHTLPLQVLQRSGVFVSGVRNLGAAQVDTDVLAFLDADCLPEADWIERGLTRLAMLGTNVILGGAFRIPPNSSLLARSWYEQRNEIKTGPVGYLPCANLFIRRTEFLQLGGFDESLQTNEDSELCSRARLHGFRVIADPDLAVVHLGTPQTLAQFYRQQRWHGTNVFRVFLRSGGRQNLKPVALALNTIVFGFAVICSLIYGLWTGSYIFAIAASAAWLLPAFVMSFLSISRHGRIQYLLPLTAVIFLYGMARGASILKLGKSTRLYGVARAVSILRVGKSARKP